MKKTDRADCTLNPVVRCAFGCECEEPQFFPERLKQLTDVTPQSIFIDSRCDIADWRSEWIEQVFAAMRENPQHTYMLLTKRPGVFDEMQYRRKLPIGENFWYGTTITGSPHSAPFISSQLYNAFISFDPLLGPISDWGFALSAIHYKTVKWVIIGAETGSSKSKVVPNREWVQRIVYGCKTDGVPVFLKNSLAEIWGEPLVQEYPW
jgi:protein gp37